MYEALSKSDFPRFEGVSYLYPRILKKSILEYAQEQIIIFHPAPVSIHEGVAACCFCLLHEYKEWAVTAHCASQWIDEGDIIEERWFSLTGAKTAIDVERLVQKQSIELFQEVLEKIIGGNPLPRKNRIFCHCSFPTIQRQRV